MDLKEYKQASAVFSNIIVIILATLLAYITQISSILNIFKITLLITTLIILPMYTLIVLYEEKEHNKKQEILNI
jgi:predicted neutral ceramidase superfamily lipid hydrolase